MIHAENGNQYINQPNQDGNTLCMFHLRISYYHVPWNFYEFQDIQVNIEDIHYRMTIATFISDT